MYKIEKKDYGFKLTFDGFIHKDEMTNWVNESVAALENQTGKFGVFVDMRTLKTLPQESKDEMERGQKLFKEKGMERSVVILASGLLAMQFKGIARETGIYDWERYIDASSNANWEKKGIDWVKNAVDPDK